MIARGQSRYRDDIAHHPAATSSSPNGCSQGNRNEGIAGGQARYRCDCRPGGLHTEMGRTAGIEQFQKIAEECDENSY